MERSPLQRALHANRVARRDFLPFGQPLHLLIEITLELALEGIQVGAAMLEHIGGSDVMQHRVEQMLQADIFVAAIDRLGHRKLQGYLKLPADVYRRRHDRRDASTPSPSCTSTDTPPGEQVLRRFAPWSPRFRTDRRRLLPCHSGARGA